MKRLFAFVLSFGLVAVVAVPAVATNGAELFYGGGQIIEGDNKISFGGEANADLVGEIQVNFHNVPDSSGIDGSRFHSTLVQDFNWFSGGSGNCDSAMNATFLGRFDGEDGYRLIFRAGDNEDTVRFELRAPGGALVYDTFGSGSGFTAESNCVGTARTGLDRGNVTIVP